jgi:2-iminobutanoate/2-iminopropanoate deaminase
LTFVAQFELITQWCGAAETGGRSQLLMREIVSTKDAPQAIGPYSQAIKANGFVFTSGQIAIDPATQQVVAGDVAAQTERVLQNLSEILEAAGSGLGKVVRCTVFLKNMDDFAAMNAVYAKYFSSAPPSRSTVEVARLPRDVLVEIDVIALV